MLIKRWGRVAWHGLAMFKGEWLMHRWESELIQVEEMKKGRGRPIIKLEVVKMDLSNIK